MNSRQSQRQQLNKEALLKKKKTPAKNAKSAQNQAKSTKEPQEKSLIPLELQQLLLNIFKNSFSELFETNFQPLLQEVKGHLYNRDFLTAFGRNDYLETYAARWSPSRALGYLQVLASTKDVFHLLQHPPEEKGKIVCIGGGAGAEIVAFSGVLNYLRREKAKGSNEEKDQEQKKPLEAVNIDIADWSSVVKSLEEKITTPPPVSKYASAAVREANAFPLVKKEDISITFQQQDVLQADLSKMAPLFAETALVTIMFTLNELYSMSLSLTQKFLLFMTANLPVGALLLVVDSPGSYSSVTLNGAEKKYPMQWLLDHTLLKEGADGAKAWEKIEEDESKWFRIPEGLKYPIELENMRLQLHLYRRIC